MSWQPWQLVNVLDDVQKLHLKSLFARFVTSIESSETKLALRFKHDQLLYPQETPENKSYNGLRFASKLGGSPFWPQGKAFCPQPEEDYDDFKKANNMGDLRLAVQINLQDVPEEQRSALNYPQDGGILQFYVSSSPDSVYGLYGNAEAGPGYHIVYWPKSVVDQYPVDDALADLQSAHPPPAENEMFFMNRAKPLRIDFEQGLAKEVFNFTDNDLKNHFFDFLKREGSELLQFAKDKYKETDEYEQSSQNMKSPDHLENFVNSTLQWQFLGVIQEDQVAECGGNYQNELECSKLGGRSFFVQDDPRDGWPAESKEQLLQLASGGQVMIGDCGTMQFFNCPANTSRGRFGGVRYNWACS